MEEHEKLGFMAALLPFSLVLFVIVLGVLLLNQQFNKKLYRQKVESDGMKLRYQRELLRSSIQVQEDERRRIARDLHDELGAALSMARMHLVQLGQRPASERQLPQTLLEIREIIEAALASMRRISHELVPPQLESFGLLQTLDVLKNQLNGLQQVRMEIRHPVDFPRFPIQTELGLYRICLELVNNTLKHANAAHIGIRFLILQDTLQLDYSDDGKGMPETDAASGLGHRNIEARVNALGGTFTVGPASGPGFHARIGLPVNPT